MESVRPRALAGALLVAPCAPANAQGILRPVVGVGVIVSPHGDLNRDGGTDLGVGSSDAWELVVGP